MYAGELWAGGEEGRGTCILLGLTFTCEYMYLLTLLQVTTKDVVGWKKPYNISWCMHSIVIIRLQILHAW